MDILSYLKENTVLLDGAMGTLLQAKGLPAGEYPERWNVSHPEVVTGAHRAYFDAGSNIVLTNTFGANALKFEDEELRSVVTAAVENARRAAETSTGTQEKFVALDIGPLGRLLAPYGDLAFETAVQIFSKTVKAALPAGPDLVFIETMNDSYETKAALLAVRESCDLPVFVSNSYGQDGRLMTGASPEAMIVLLESMGADAIGLNCSLGPEEMRPVIEQYLSLASVPVIVKPNAGLPQVVDGKTVFTVGAETFAAAVAEFVKKGAKLAGGCCGTSPEYIRALKKSCQEIGETSPIVMSVEKETSPMGTTPITTVSSYTHAVRFGQRPVLIGERINPTGKKRLKQALKEKDLTYILKEADGQAKAGADMLDVNAGMPEIREPEILELLVKEIQAVTDLPLVIDTADPAALERALRVCNGKPLINSVSGKRESMDAVFPLMKKYGGAVIALTLDENGIPETAEGRLAIAERIVREAALYGIRKKDIIVDPLAMTVSASSEAALVTLEAVRLIRERLGVCTSLGVSNISFGLPERTVINRTFFALALEQGLSAAILNPYSGDMMETAAAFRVLHGMDPGCGEYIAMMAERETEPEGRRASAEKHAAAAMNTAENGEQDPMRELFAAVVRGMKSLAAELAEKLQEKEAPMRLIEQAVIPALNEVGDRFEKKRLFLPQLLLSAEAASEVFESVRKHTAGKTGTGKLSAENSGEISAGSAEDAAAVRSGKIVLATVRGDIHDIGKGIVRLLLENYGFDVLDLGKDVPEETVVEAVLREKAPVCGLSALMTTTVPAMERTIRRLHESCPWCKVVVGGAVLTASYAEEIGADRYSATAMDTVRYAQECFKETEGT